MKRVYNHGENPAAESVQINKHLSARLRLGMDTIDTALVVTATVRRSGRLVGVLDVDVTNETGQLVAIGCATSTTAT